MAPRIWFFKDFIKNPQTTIALTFLTHIISGIDGVYCLLTDNIVSKRTFVHWLQSTRSSFLINLRRSDLETVQFSSFHDDHRYYWNLRKLQLLNLIFIFKFIMSHWNLEFIAAYFKCNVQPLWFRWIHSTYICISPTHSHILLCTLWNQIENCQPISIYTPRLIKIRGH